MSAITLRPYQNDALAAIAASSARAQLIALPTGTGKTVVFSELVRRRGGTALILAHRDELLQQAGDKLRMVAPELAMSIGLVQAGQDDVGAPVVLGSVQTLASRRRLARLPTDFRTVVIDEAHHATANSYRAIIAHCSGAELIVGFTATPERHDRGSDLRTVFDAMPFARSIERMIRDGYLCDLRAERITLDLDLSKVKKSGGDFQAEALGQALVAAHGVEHAVAAYLKLARGKRCIAFFPTVATSLAARDAFVAAGVRAEHVDGTTPRDERRGILRHLSTGQVELVCNVGVLTEGFDEPSLGCILIAAPTRSRIKYAQMVGRGTRLYPGKTECLILDLAGVSDDLTIQSVGILFGLRKPPKPGETATQASDRERAEEIEQEVERHEQVQISTLKPTIKSRPVKLFKRDDIHWQTIGERFVVGLKGETLIVLDPQEAGWRVLLMSERGYRVAAENLDLGYAQGAAEHLIRTSGTVSLADREAPWRQLPASAGQRGKLWHMGVSCPAGATRGQAADLITEHSAAERLVRFDRSTERCPA